MIVYTKVTYRMIKFPKQNRWVGVAWNYDEAVLFSPGSFETYTEAKLQLDIMARNHDVSLAWFDGEYEADGDMLIPLKGKENV